MAAGTAGSGAARTFSDLLEVHGMGERDVDRFYIENLVAARMIVDGEITPEEAVKAYHNVLAQLKIAPHRSLEDDLQLQSGVMSYSGRSTVTVPTDPPSASDSPQTKPPCLCGGPDPNECKCAPDSAESSTKNARSAAANGKPDFSTMTQAEKLAYNRARLNRIFG